MKDTHKPIGFLGCYLCGHWIGDETAHDTSALQWADA